jgi:hypothetical protein
VSGDADSNNTDTQLFGLYLWLFYRELLIPVEREALLVHNVTLCYMVQDTQVLM